MCFMLYLRELLYKCGMWKDFITIHQNLKVIKGEMDKFDHTENVKTFMVKEKWPVSSKRQNNNRKNICVLRHSQRTNLPNI